MNMEVVPLSGSIVEKSKRSFAYDLSIVITSWNTVDLLWGCLDSILETEWDLRIEIIVVDNGSSDGSAGMIQREFPQVNLIANTENLGFAKACNQGIRVSHGRYVLLLNSDTVVRQHTLAQMVDFMDHNQDCGASGCKLVNSDGSIQLASARRIPKAWDFLLYATRLPKLFPECKIFGHYTMVGWDRNSTRQVECLSGAFLLIRREVINSVGLLDESFFFLGEDIDFCLRIGNAGWELWYFHEVEVLHYGQQSSKNLYTISYQDVKSKSLYLDKNFSLLQGHIYAFGIVGISLCKTIYHGIFGFFSLSERKRAVQYLRTSLWSFHFRIKVLFGLLR